jgi:hypothetical protein
LKYIRKDIPQGIKKRGSIAHGGKSRPLTMPAAINKGITMMAVISKNRRSKLFFLGITPLGYTD